MRSAVLPLALTFGLVIAGVARATVSISVDLSAQRLHAGDGRRSYTWPVSSGGDGYATPDGSFRPQRLIADAHSNLYANAPMPHAIFFLGPFAIHGTYETRFLGHPVSHGCVRLPPAAAATLFALVQKEGATIRIEGVAPKGWHVYGKKHLVGAMAKPAARPIRRIASKAPPRPRLVRVMQSRVTHPARPVFYGAATPMAGPAGARWPTPYYRPGLIGWALGEAE